MTEHNRIGRITAGAVIVESVTPVDKDLKPTGKRTEITVYNTDNGCKKTLAAGSQEERYAANIFKSEPDKATPADKHKYEQLITGTGMSFVFTNPSAKPLQQFGAANVPSHLYGDLMPLAKLVADPNACEKGTPTR